VFRDLLVAVDASPGARRALEEAVDLAVATDARLTIITVVPDVSVWLYRVPVDPAQLAEQAEGHMGAVLREAEAFVPHEVPVTTILARGRAGPRIVERAIEGGHDLVVVGSRGFGETLSVILGSVSHHVLHHCPVPVLIVRPPERPGA
jgi:nucleotide-binding universal stress UspA family protein